MNKRKKRVRRYYKNFKKSNFVADKIEKSVSEDNSLEAQIKITIDELEALKLEINSHR